MASLRRKPTNGSASTETPTSSVSSPEIPLPGTAANSEGVMSLRAQMESLKRAQELQPDTPTVEDRRKQWLASTEAARSNYIYSHLGNFHQQALESGLTDMGPGYTDFMNQRIAELATQTPGTHLVEEMNRLAAREPKEPPQRAEPDRSAIVSAPVSREPPSSYYGIGRPTRFD